MTRRMWTRLIVGMASYDVMIAMFVGYFWIELFHIGELATWIALVAIRFGVSYACARVLFEPVERWAANSSTSEDGELLAVDEAIERGSARLVWAYGLGWSSILVLSMVLTAVGVPASRPLGLAEILTGSVFMLALALSTAHVFRVMIDHAVGELRSALGSELGARRLTARRTFTSFVASTVVWQTSSVLGIFLGITSIGGILRVQALRDNHLLEQRHRAEHAALEQRTGVATLPAGVVIVDGVELPESLRTATPDVEHTLGVHELDRGEALAAAPLGDGRFVLARAPIDEQLGSFMAFLLVVMLAISAPLAAANLWFARALAGKLRELRSATRRVVEDGELADIERIVAPRNDEVGILANDFNGMLDMFEELTRAAQKVAEGDLRVELQRPGDLHDAFRTMVRRLGEMVVEIRTTASELASAAAQIHAVARAQEQAATQQSASVREVGATAASLAAAAKQITVTAQLVLDNADQSRETTESMIARIAELRGEANGVGDLLETIREVADRSDLLALNGSLEATRAGEAGRGFALVAAEMRRLAERVNAAALIVGQRVKSIEGAGAGTVSAIEEAKLLAERTATAAQQISSVTAQQSRDTEQVSHAIEDVNQAAIATAAATSQTSAAAQQLESKAAALELLTGRFELRASS